jgi:hypothetical protein
MVCATAFAHTPHFQLITAEACPSRCQGCCQALLLAERKTGPLRSRQRHKGPALSRFDATPNGCKRHFRSFGEMSLCVRVVTRRLQFVRRGYGYFFFLEVFFATFLVAAFAVFFAFFAFLAMSSSVKKVQ